MKPIAHFIHTIFLLTLLIGLSGCNLPASSETTPTINITQAYQTVEARLTQAIAQTPQTTPQPPPTFTAINTEVPATSTAALPSATTVPTTSVLQKACNIAAPGFPIDVTIPDDTVMNPGQTFTKIWRLKNIGSCTWTTDYKVQLFSGEAMGAPVVINLPQIVAPGQEVDISVDLLAPQAAGTYQGNWKLRTAADEWFGIGSDGNSHFWVRIQVKGGATATITSTVTATSTPLPPVQVSGLVNLALNSRLDLDTNQINSGAGEDLSFEVNAEGMHLMIPLGTVILGVFSEEQPTFNDCKSAPLSAQPIILENLSSAVYLCYRTNLGLPGRMLLANFNAGDGTVSLETLTWSIP